MVLIDKLYPTLFPNIFKRQVETGETVRRFVGHTSDVLGVSISDDNRIVVTCSRDKTIRVWNTHGECKYIMEGFYAHQEWVSGVTFFPKSAGYGISSISYDGTNKLWDLPPVELNKTLSSSTNYLTCQVISPDSSLLAMGGKDCLIYLHSLGEKHIPLVRVFDVRPYVENNSRIYSLCFSPNRFWLAVGCLGKIFIYDLELRTIISQISVMRTPHFNNELAACLSLCWSHDGKYLYVGADDNSLHVFTYFD